MEQGFKIARGMQHPRNADRPNRRILGNQIGQHWPEPDILVGEVVAPVPGPRRRRQKAQRAGDLTQHMARHARPGLLQGKVANLRDIPLRLRREI